ncbi:hypothetical protein ACJJTC_017657 [Scirpophaga incertulas]
MGKRKRDKSNEDLLRRVRKLEKELRSRSRRLPSYSDGENMIVRNSNSESEGDEHDDPDCCSEYIEEDYEASQDGHVAIDAQNQEELAGVKSACVRSDLPAEILLSLGEAKKSEEGIGKKIPVEISERLEISDYKKSQNQLGTGIAGLVNLIADLIEGQINNTEIIKRISEVNQILLDMHHEETMNRRRLIIPLLDKSFWNIIHGVKRDEFLFGDNLNENIKVSKIIEKAGQQIKKPITASTSKKPFQQQGNLQRPPRPGTTRTFHVQAPPPPPPSRYYREAPPPAPAPTRRQAPSTATRSRGGHQSRPYDKRHRR